MELCVLDKNKEVTRYNKNDVTICIDPAAIEYKGEIATFLVTVLFQQNASWQGTILWVEGKKSEDFRSVLELLKLIADVTIASAILDRVLHQCTVIHIKGESYRLKERKEYMKQKIQANNTLFDKAET